MRKHTEAGLRRKGTFFVRDMTMHTEPITIRNKLNSASIADARLKSDGEREKEREGMRERRRELKEKEIRMIRY